MALAHFWMQNVSRAKAHMPASLAVHYLKREAEFAAEAYLKRTSASTKDRADLRADGVRHLPAWAENSPGKFFSAAERYEGANRYHAIMLQFSLPREMTHEQHLALTKDFIEATMHDKPLLWVKHEPLDKYTHAPQPHTHILLSARKVAGDGIERGPAQTFMRWNAKHPATGGCEKDLFWSRRQAVEQLRQAFTDLTNFHSEKLGLDVRIDSRSLNRRDIARKPMYKPEDRPSREALATEQRQAAATWEQRKAYKELGDIHTISREEMVLLVRQWTRDYAPGERLPRVEPQGRVEPRVRHDPHATVAELAWIEQRLHDLDGAKRQVRYYVEAARPLPAPVEQRIHRLLQEEFVLPDTKEERTHGGRAARVRVWDEREEHQERHHHDQR